MSSEELERIVVCIGDGSDTNAWSFKEILSAKDDCEDYYKSIGIDITKQGEIISEWIWGAVDNDGNQVDFIQVKDNVPYRTWFVK